ncbi:hypothetical protein Tco_0800652 [Tanacetum coccineum]|uniref:Synaptobrevin, longin-like domain protein n=1 Tax=Tanacetum coccineum TaxID=301880 RepID=A0ABQ4ZTS4_9ASTR
MAIMNSCNKHNMIACVEKTERNADFHDVIDFLTGCSMNYALLVSPDVAGKKILVSEASVRTDLMFNDEDGTNCFDNQVIWDFLRDIGYEGNLQLLSFSKPLLSPQWKYLVHTLLHCLSSKSSSWDQFATNIASALVGLATNQKFNFSKLIFDGMLRNLKDSKPFLMYPRFIQLFLNKQLEGSTKPQTFLPTVVLPPKVFTFMRKCSPKFSGKLTPLTPPMLEVVTAVRAEHALHTEDLDIHPSSHHSDDSSAGKKAASPSSVASERPASPNDYTPTDEVQTSGGDEGHLDLHGLTRELKPTLSKKKKLKKGDSQMMNVDDTITTEVHKVEVARKVAAENEEEEEERKRLAGLERLQDELEDNEMIAAEVQRIERENFTKEQKAKFLVETIAAQRRFRAEQQAALRRSKPPTISQLRNQMMKFYKECWLWILEDEVFAQDVDIMEQRSSISSFSIIQSPKGEYIAVQRANGHIRAFNTLNETEWEIIRWRLYESTGVHILELENGIMIHMLVEQRYPLTRELMQRMLEHKLEVQRETEDALNVIRFVMKQKEDLEREEE